MSFGGAPVSGSVAGVLLAATLAVVPSPAAAAPQPQPSARPASEALLLIVDYSGSMKEPDGRGSTRIQAAKDALGTIITALPEDLDVGLRVYGHRVPSADKAAACEDTELAVPVGPLDRDGLRATVDGLQALGETPIGLSLQQAAQDLPEGVTSTVILVSDGADECYPDDLGPEPCEVTKQLVAQGVNLRLETIGLQVEESGAEQLQCMAEAGGGQFTSVEDAGLLAEALAAAQNRALRVFEPRGEPVAGGPSLIDATVLEPGTYSDSILDGETLWYAVDVPQGGSMTARLTIRTADVPAEALVALEWQDPQARRVDVGLLNGISRGQASTLATSTGEANGSRSPYGAEREAGPYYLAVRTGGFPPDAAHDFVLELLPDGQSAEATAAASPAPSASPAGPAAGAEASTDDGGAPSPPLPSAGAEAVELPPPPSTSPLPLLLVILLAAGGGVGYLVWRRRTAGHEEPDEPTYG
ncbi:VWA domain-containing protein [Aquipuribacter sp. MA13-6]|uniref:VWA domain-containing protein n=1 Tax=unclassified Aquipuribacter TaxID=2635084 RepID=UPI003EEA2044